MKIDLPESVLEILDKFDGFGYEIYIVGGAVRDLLMGRLVNDWDFATNATPEQILKVIPEGFYDNQFGTVGLTVEDYKKPFEITTYRTEEGYSDARHPDKISWGKTLEEDLSRRDFTINAMALGAVQSTKHKAQSEKTKYSVLGTVYLIDPFNGQSDIDKGIIKAVGNADDRFSEDALRMMRVIRIAGELGFNIQGDTFDAIKKNAPLINKIAKERVKEELFKLISSPNPYDGILLFRNSGLMQEILPELEKCFGVEQKSPGRHHIYDVGTHLLMALKFCKSEDTVTRFATLIHDIGKPQTYRKLENGTITFYNHEMVSTKIAESIADRLRFSKKEKDKLIILVRWHQFTVDEHQTDSAIRRVLRNVGLENMDDMLALRVADRLGGGARETSWRLEEFKARLIEVQKQPFSIKDLKIDGNDVMKVLRLRSGPEVGKILSDLFEKVVNKEIENNKENLTSELKKFNDLDQ
ncbi:MAG: tRNA adenylyl-/cytidylyl-transferase [Candidatus Woesebacteria bacterium GW2011_GWA2_40_7]|uniref:tRNA adenylyl-/cytidylyl-transferase n=3 Tax=Candidatus Woeseibacteriota TaxID=1752722 RepID=A0A0G0PRK6_9BACT|nr:MAG: tRNA adenylyl-/cytidylyl-transferase [Candidatus Woesebacteria bacterium GW2011_GWB1_39_10]KKR72022.1 MAG: tRNA adenylyl-/cytidylyl-transferase [Candidatus Woesebacteria bacterium GW2011_GWA2_40_7]KKS90961.1 MAG: tRNA adenylyl-/cytidylyl-transferase [Candidatus Woesebacteria bacterium GW2011_GWA1_43_12]